MSRKLFTHIEDTKDDHVLILRKGKLYQVIEKETTDEILDLVNCGEPSNRVSGFYTDIVHLVSSKPAKELFADDVEIRALR
jgi:hypothetical protein